MSTFAQVLPSPVPHFGHNQSFFTSPAYPTYPGYSSIDTVPQSIFTPLAEQPFTSISPQLISTSPRYVEKSRRVSQVSSTPSSSIRDRTPIRHHRPSVARTRTISRPGQLLSYALEEQEQQQQQQPEQREKPAQTTLSMSSSQPQQQYPMQQANTILQSQSKVETPPIYQATPQMTLPVTTAAYQSQSAYYAPPMSHTSQQYVIESSAYGTDLARRSGYTLNRSVSHPLSMEHQTVNPQEAIYLPNPMNPGHSQLPTLSSNSAFPPTSQALESSPETFRVLTSRPKPQCFDHGCNGRQFSTFSNLLRHQREKSGSATKAICPHCGTEFTRTTARNGHMFGGKCKGIPEQGQSGENQAP